MPLNDLAGSSNFILGSLSKTELSLLQDDLEPVALLPQEILQQAGEAISHVYFPTTGIIALLASTPDGASTELAMLGNEGMGDISLVLGDNSGSHKLVVQTAGHAFRLKAEIMRWELAQGGRLQRLALRYSKALLAQIGQNLVCSKHHSIEQQLCRWLLLAADRVSGQQISITQDRLANLLGVRREAITLGARKLLAAGLIEYRRGQMFILDRPGLAAHACECYEAIHGEYARYFASTAEIIRPNRLRAHPASLRQRAEARWRELPMETTASPADFADLRHELEIRKIELEISNEALHQAHDEADALSERYADIYDFAPIGYFTLDAAGNILDLNLAGAILLGLKRSQKSRHRFVSYLAPESQAVFTQFVDKILHEKTGSFCEITLVANPLRVSSILRVEAVPDEDGTECRMVLMDITEQRAALRALENSELRYRRFIENLPLAKGIAARPGHDKP